MATLFVLPSVKYAKSGIKARPLPSSPSRGRLLLGSLRSIDDRAFYLLGRA